MLNMMRENLRHLKWVLIIVAASMVLYLGSMFECRGGAQGPSGTGWAARIDGLEISEQSFLNAARNLDRYYRNLLGDGFEQMKPQLQIGRQALSGLIQEALVIEDAYRLGLTISDAELAEAIRSDHNLQDQTGRFIGMERYVQIYSRGFPGGVTAYERALRNSILMDKWADVMTVSVRVSDEELKRVHRQRTEKTAVDYVVVASAEQKVGTEPTEHDVRRWYDEHADEYVRDPGRKIRYVVVQREAQLASIEVTDDEIRAAYESNRERYAHPEQRRARHILFRFEPGMTDEEKAPLREQAQRTLERVKSGEDFATLARGLSGDPVSRARGGDLDFFSRGQKAFETAVWDSPVGTFAPLTETEFGFHVIQVTDARDEGVVPLETVRAEISRTLSLRRAEELVVAEAQRLRERVGAADRLEEVATADGLRVESRFATPGDRLADVGASPDFLRTIFELEPGGMSQPVRVAAGMAIVVVDEITAAELAPFEEVEAQSRVDLLDELLRRAALETAREAMDRGGSLAAAAKTLDLEVLESGDLAPGNPPSRTGGSTPELEKSLFGPDVAEGDSGVVEVPLGTMIYRVTRREVFDPLAFESARPELRREIETDRRERVRQSIVAKLQERKSIVINDPLVRRIDG